MRRTTNLETTGLGLPSVDLDRGFFCRDSSFVILLKKKRKKQKKVTSQKEGENQFRVETKL